MVYIAKIRLSATSTIEISYNEENNKATITEVNSGKTATATLTGGAKKSSADKEGGK